MRKCLVLTAMLCMTVLFTCPAIAGSTYVLTFDDVATPTNNIWGTITDGYQGFEWDGFGAISIQGYQKQKEYKNDKVSFPSAPVAVFNGSKGAGAGVVTLANTQPFLLEGGYFSTWDKNNKPYGQSADGLTITGYLNGEVKGSTEFSLAPNFVWQAFNFGPVDQVKFTVQGNNDKRLWLMDNVQVSEVSLPTTLGLFCGGLLALFVFGRRRASERSL